VPQVVIEAILNSPYSNPQHFLYGRRHLSEIDQGRQSLFSSHSHKKKSPKQLFETEWTQDSSRKRLYQPSA
jgi:hypothetical protein